MRVNFRSSLSKLFAFGAILVVGAIPCVAAGAPAPGEASGALTVDGKALALKHAYAVVELDLESRETVALILTDLPIPEQAASDGSPLSEVLRSGGPVSGLHVRLIAGEMPEGWGIVHPDLSTGCAICSDWKADIAARTKDAVKGQIHTTEKETYQGQAFEFDAEFNAQVKIGWEAAAEARATPAQRTARRALREAGSHFTPAAFAMASLIDPASIKRFLEAGMPADTVSLQSGDTALLDVLARAEAGPEFAASALALIRAGADVNRVSKELGDAPLARASGSAEIVKALLDAGAKLDGPSGMPDMTAGQALMERAVRDGKATIVRLLVARGYKLDADRARLLEMSRGSAEIEAILAKGAPAEAKSMPVEAERDTAQAKPVPARVKHDPAQARQALASKSIAFTEDAFWGALMERDAEAVLLFLDAGMSPNPRRPHVDDTPLLFVSTWDYTQDGDARTAIALGLIAHGADVNAGDQNKATPLLHAAQYCPVEVVRALLKAGASTKARAAGGATPLMMAVIFGRADNVQALLEAGYDAAPELETLLPIASAHPEIAKMLKDAAGRKR